MNHSALFNVEIKENSCKVYVHPESSKETIKKAYEFAAKHN